MTSLTPHLSGRLIESHGPRAQPHRQHLLLVLRTADLSLGQLLDLQLRQSLRVLPEQPPLLEDEPGDAGLRDCVEEPEGEGVGGEGGDAQPLY